MVATGPSASGNRLVDIPRLISISVKGGLSKSVIVEFTVPASALTMQETLAVSPEMIVEIERVVAHERGTLMPYFWVRGGDMERLKPLSPTTSPSPRRCDSISTKRGPLLQMTVEEDPP